MKKPLNSIRKQGEKPKDGTRLLSPKGYVEKEFEVIISRKKPLNPVEVLRRKIKKVLRDYWDHVTKRPDLLLGETRLRNKIKI